jgi:cystathionine beta-synthase
MASVLDLIGETPLIEVTKFDCGPCRLFLKLESANPSGSIKDRPARFMIEAAEAGGRLKPGGTIVEATAGNTGLGLALIGGRKDYRIVLVVPDKMAREKIFQCKAMGAEVVLTRSDVSRGHPDYYQDLAEAITARTPGAVYINQFANPANPKAHESTTGPEILRQMQGNVDAIVVGVGSGGTLTGVGRFLAKHSPKSRMILADPLGSVLAPFVESGRIPKAGSWSVEGIGEDFVPPNADLKLVHKAYAISDPDSFACARELLRLEGILAGSSSGTLLAAALRYCREQSEPHRVVSLVCDSGAKYLSFPKIISARSDDAVHPRLAQQRRYQTVGLLDAVAHPCAVIGACAIHYSRRRTCSEFASGAPRQRSASDPGTRGAQCRSGVPHTRFARAS